MGAVHSATSGSTSSHSEAAANARFTGAGGAAAAAAAGMELAPNGEDPKGSVDDDNDPNESPVPPLASAETGREGTSGAVDGSHMSE